MIKQRYGYSAPIVTGSVSTGTINSAFYFESVTESSPGKPSQQCILYGDGASLYQLTVGTTTNTSVRIDTLTDSLPFSAFIASNKLFISGGHYQKMTDGTTLRPSGIPSPTSAQTASITVIENTGSTGSWGPTTLSGYQFYMSFYNPITGHVGNRSPIGLRLQILGTQSIVVISNLPNLSGVNPEWLKLLGRTADGGQVPYAIEDFLSGVWITVSNTGTVATLTQGPTNNLNMPDTTVDFNSELPTRNGLPPLMHKTCYALGRAYGIDDTDPHLIDYSESESDLYGAASFVGRPEESWDALSQIPFPQNETARSIQEYGNEVWVGSRNYTAILTELGQYSPDGVPQIYWRGVWAGGWCGQRAFVKTPYGPFWLSPQKELMTYSQSGPISVSKEYQAAFLADFTDNQLQNVELAYLRDPTRDIDRIYILGPGNS